MERVDSYVLNLTTSKLESDLLPFVFDDQRIFEIIKAIINMNVTGEFNTMAHGYGEAVLPALTSGIEDE